MKTILQILFFTFIVQHSFGQFITTWETTRDNQEIIIPTRWDEYTYNYSVNWGDGNISTNQTQHAKHTYTTKGTYTVTITGTFPAIYFGFTGSRLSIKSVEQWGNNPWLTMNRAFVQCDNLSINATDNPNLSNATSMSYMFYTAGINQSLDNWDVSNITDMSFMFSNSDFNQDIGSWDVSNVRNMEGMFLGTLFNKDIGAWNVGNVTNMKSMFGNTEYFNQDISAWNVSKVTTMNQMFYNADRFNQDLGNWNVSNVQDMSQMFHNAIFFNQDIGNWNVSNVTNMSSMFSNSENFDQNIGNWDVSQVTNMKSMFNSADIFNQAIGSWNVSRVEDMEDMFKDTNAFNQDIGNWDVSNVTTMESMFDGNRVAFNQDIGNWDVSNVTDMQDMFRGANLFNQDIGSWNVSKVANMQGMFYGARDFNQDISGWNVSNVTDMEAMFAYTTSFNQDISSWDVSNVTIMSSMFGNALAFNQNLSSWNVSNVSRMTYMLSNSGLSRSNYDALLKGWATQTLKPNVSLGVIGLNYCAGEADRNVLTSAPNNWNISGDSKDCEGLTVILDPNFEQYLIDESIDSDGVINGQVLKVDIENVTQLLINDKNISDLTGIQDFKNLVALNARNNNLMQIDVSNNVLLENINLENNQLTTVDFSNNVSLKDINVGDNQLTNLDVHLLENLENLQCYKNQLTSINLISNTKLLSFVANENQLKQVDIRVNTNLIWIDVDDNVLESLTIKNSNNTSIAQFSATGNSNLTCIEVDDVSFSETNWTAKDATANFSTDCAPANDDCSFAIPLILGQETPGDINSGTFTNATDCVAGTIIADVWYSITVPETGQFSVEGSGFGGLLKFAIYESCASTSSLSCGLNISLKNLTPGTVYYLKVWMEASSGGNKSQVENGTFTLKSQDSSILSVDDFIEENSFTLFPNPVTNTLTISTTTAFDSFEIYTVTGKKVINKKVENSSESIDVHNLASGVYILKVISENSILQRKFIKR